MIAYHAIFFLWWKGERLHGAWNSLQKKCPLCTLFQSFFLVPSFLPQDKAVESSPLWLMVIAGQHRSLSLNLRYSRAWCGGPENGSIDCSGSSKAHLWIVGLNQRLCKDTQGYCLKSWAWFPSLDPFCVRRTGVSVNVITHMRMFILWLLWPNICIFISPPQSPIVTLSWEESSKPIWEHYTVCRCKSASQAHTVYAVREM